VATRAELTIDAGALEGLPDATALRLRRAFSLDAGPLRITSQEQRALAQNREACAQRLLEMVRAALAPPPPPRRKTRPTAAARARRVTQKRTRGEVKRLRRPPASSGD
jgi:ribosome-associated protein